MLVKADPKARQILKESSLCLISDLNPFMSGKTISYLELCQGMIASKTITKEIYETHAVKQPNLEALKEIALEAAP